MSELAEIRAALSDIKASTTATATDVKWIKEGMEGHGQRLYKVESKVTWFAGAWGMAGTIAGAVLVWLKSH